MDAYVTGFLTAVMTILAVVFKPDISIQTWAREEAQARLDLKEKGFTDFKFGTHYNTSKAIDREAQWDTFLRKVSFVFGLFRPDLALALIHATVRENSTIALPLFCTILSRLSSQVRTTMTMKRRRKKKMRTRRKKKMMNKF